MFLLPSHLPGWVPEPVARRLGYTPTFGSVTQLEERLDADVAAAQRKAAKYVNQSTPPLETAPRFQRSLLVEHREIAGTAAYLAELTDIARINLGASHGDLQSALANAAYVAQVLRDELADAIHLTHVNQVAGYRPRYKSPADLQTALDSADHAARIAASQIGSRKASTLQTARQFQFGLIVEHAQVARVEAQLAGLAGAAADNLDPADRQNANLQGTLAATRHGACRVREALAAAARATQSDLAAHGTEASEVTGSFPPIDQKGAEAR